MKRPDCLVTSISLRMPVRDPDASERAHIESIESYMLLTAFQQGELAEERLRVREQLRGHEREWAHLEGYQPLVGNRKTDAAVDDAKRRVKPDLYDSIEEARWLVRELDREFERLASDGDRCSRLLTPARVEALVPAQF